MTTLTLNRAMTFTPRSLRCTGTATTTYIVGKDIPRPTRSPVPTSTFGIYLPLPIDPATILWCGSRERISVVHASGGLWCSRAEKAAWTGALGRRGDRAGAKGKTLRDHRKGAL